MAEANDTTKQPGACCKPPGLLHVESGEEGTVADADDARLPIKGYVLPKTQAHGDADKSGGLLPYIAAFKFVKAALLLVAGSAAVGLVNPTWLHEIERWLSYVSSPTHRELLKRVLARALHHDPRTLAGIAFTGPRAARISRPATITFS